MFGEQTFAQLRTGFTLEGDEKIPMLDLPAASSSAFLTDPFLFISLHFLSSSSSIRCACVCGGGGGGGGNSGGSVEACWIWS